MAINHEPMKLLDGLQDLLADRKYVELLARLESLAGLGSGVEGSRPFAYLRAAALSGLGRWLEVIEEANLLLEPLGPGDSDREVALVHGLAGHAHLRRGNLRAAEAHLRASIHIFTWCLRDRLGALKQRRRLAIMFKNEGHWNLAEHEIAMAISEADELGALREGVGLRINLAVVALKRGAFDRLPGLFDEIDVLRGKLGTPGPGHLIGLLRGRTHVLRRELSKAAALLHPLLETFREHRLSREEAICLEYLGDCFLLQKEFKKALEHYEAAQRIADETAPGGDLVPELGHRIGEALVGLGDPNAAILACERGLRVARDTSDRYEECATHRVLAMANWAAGNRTKAIRLATEGIALGRSYEIPYELARALQWAGEARLQGAPDEHAEGRRQLWEARGIYARLELNHQARSIDEALGIEPRPEPPSEEQARGVLEGMENLDRGALLFGVITCNREMSEAVATLQSVAPSKIPVMITGPSGVGKELFAKALHLMSDRRRGPFVPVNCGAISQGLIDSEFFGHERGAFTGAVTSREGLVASAHQGTLFLDEIGDMPAAAQATLLRVLESGELRPVGRDDVRQIDVRIVAATNASLDDLVERGIFRRDLFYRLNGASVTLPPLREREEDIRALFRYFWSQATSAARKSLTLSDEVESMLLAYSWPGNVRELKHEVMRVVAMAENASVVGPNAFLPRVRLRSASSLRRERERQLETDAERGEILSALRAHRGNKAEAARSLGNMKRTTLIYKIERLNIRPEEYLVEE